MKIKKIILGLLVFACIGLITCENRIMGTWWDEIPEPERFTVFFNTNGGTPEIPAQNLESGKLINRPAEISKLRNVEESELSSFLGWFTNEGVIWDFDNDKMPENNITLYAQWDDLIMVSFIPNGGNEVPPQFLNTGDLIDPPIVTRYGYIFDGWFTTPDLRFEFNFKLPVSNSNLILYAKWLEDHTFFTVTFNTNGGTPQPQPIKVAEGDVIATLPFIARAEYSFSGWQDRNDELWSSIKPVTINDVNSDGVLVLTAKWDYTRIFEEGTNDFYIAVFDASGGTPQPKAIRLSYGIPIGRLLPMTRGDDGFAGWFDENDNQWDVETDFPVSKSDVNNDGILYLTAKWQTHAPEIFEVTFDPDSSVSGSPVIKQLIAKDSLAVSPVMPKPRFSGYGFSGWYDENDILWNFDTPVTRDITLKAKWESGFCVVRFEPMGGTRPDTSTTFTHEFAVSLNYGIVPDPGPIVKPGFSFGGWYEDPLYTGTPWDFSDFAESKIKAGNSDGLIILYAKWNAKSRLIIFIENGGTDIPAPLREYDVPVGGRFNDYITIGNINQSFSRTGYTFRGWFHDPACTPGNGLRVMDYIVPEPDGISEMDNIYFYAGWMTSQLYVTFNIVGTGPITGKVADEYVEYNGLVHKPIIEPQPGRFLDGKWYKDSGFSEEWNFDIDRVTSNTDLYARYDGGGHIVTFELRDPPGGTAGFTTPDVQHIIDGGVAIEPYMPSLSPPPLGVSETRYSFYRWDTYNDATKTFSPYNFDTPVTSDLILYARWVPPVPDMVWVPRGSFIMGDAGVSGTPAAYHAYPTRRVTLDGYYISRFEITQEDGPPLTQAGTGYNQIMNTAPSQFTGTRTRPVENVSWQDAMDYCDTRSTRDNLTKPSYNNSTNTWTGDGYRLPTEAEWEYAAKGGYYWQDGFVYAGSNDATDVAWFNTTVKERPIGFQTTQTVGIKAPNQIGIYDMSGNLSEWCYDWFAPYSTLQDQLINPIGGSGPYSNANATGRVRRGGAWNNAMGNVRVAVRNSEDPTAAHWAVGFRVVRGPSFVY